MGFRFVLNEGAIASPFIIVLGEQISWPVLPFFAFGISGMLGSLTALILPETLNRELPERIADAEKNSVFGYELNEFRFKLIFKS